MNKHPDADIRPYEQPAGGWGALKSVTRTFKTHQIVRDGIKALLVTNKDGGFDCPGCAWPDLNNGKAVDSCENGMKAVAAEMTSRRADPAFFAAHTLSELRHESDFSLEDHGRLTHPMLYDAASDTYRAIDWQTAFDLIGNSLQGLTPQSVGWYASGRSSNEAAFLWQLAARTYGSNNLPDSSNLCHEPSGYAMKEAIGVGKGTATLEDFELADTFFIIGQNPQTNHPRMMGALHAAVKRGARVVAFNPLQERGFKSFSDPQDVGEMLTNTGLQIAMRVYQVKIGGDLAALKGIMRVVLDADAVAMAAGKVGVLDNAFIVKHTEGFEKLRADVLAENWDLIECESGLSRKQIEEAAQIYLEGKAVIATWCMGITQHEDSVATVQTIINLLMLRGNIGRPGAGAVPVRGHSNVQGDRTMGITVKPPAQFLDNLQNEFGFAPPRAIGRDAVSTIEGLQDGSIQGFLGLGGNFGVAVPDSPRVLASFSKSAITVHIATKFNRSHCYPGKIGLVLPCLGRTDIDVQNGKPQFVTVEDSMSMVHRSHGMKNPPSEQLLSEPVIVARIAQAVIGATHVNWLALSGDYDLVRQKIERCMQGVFDGYHDFNQRVQAAGGFRLTNHASNRVWKTASGKAQFLPHPIATNGPIHRARAKHGDDVMALMTIRSHDQFNTTVYGMDDRYRGVFGGRHVVFINQADLARLQLHDGQKVDLRSFADDDVVREVCDFKLVAFDIPQGCIAAYFPEATPLAPATLFSKITHTPAVKEIPVRIIPCINT